MKKEIGPVAIAGAVIALIAVMFVLYQFTFASKNPDPALAAPAHKDMHEFYTNQGKVDSKTGKPLQ